MNSRTSTPGDGSTGMNNENCMGQQTLDEIMNFIEGRRPSTSKCSKKSSKKQKKKEKQVNVPYDLFSTH